MIVPLAFLLLPHHFQDQTALITHSRYQGEISINAPSFTSKNLERQARGLESPVDWIDFVPQHGGPYWIVMRSDHFDPYLAILDSQGAVMAENNNSQTGMNAWVKLQELTAGEKYRVAACAFRGGTGKFELEVSEQPPRKLSFQEQLTAKTADANGRMSFLANRMNEKAREYASAENHLGEVLWEHGKYNRALDHIQRALYTRLEWIGEHHIETAESYNNLGAVHHSLQEFEKAQVAYEKALALKIGLFDQNHSSLASTLSNLALMCHLQGKIAEARRHGERALEIRRRELGKDHLRTARSLNTLAGMMKDHGLYEEALAYFSEALKIRLLHLEPDHPAIAQSLNNIGLSLYEIGAMKNNRALLDEAESKLEEALRIYEESRGKDSQQVALVANNMALVVGELGNMDSKIRYLKRALDIRTSVLGADHPLTAQSMYNYGLSLRRVNKLDEGLQLVKDAWKIIERRFGPDHYRSVRYRLSLAIALANQGQYREAWAHALEAFEAHQDFIFQALLSFSEGEGFRFLVVNSRAFRILLSISTKLEDLDSRIRTYEAILQWKAQNARVLVNGRNQILNNLSSEQAALFHRLSEVKSHLSREYHRNRSNRGNLHNSRMIELKDEESRLRRRLYESVQLEEEGTSKHSKVIENLPDGSAVIDFVQYRKSPVDLEPSRHPSPNDREQFLEAWVYSKQDPEPIRIDLGPSKPIKTAVAHLLSEVFDTSIPSTGEAATEPTSESSDAGTPSFQQQVRKALWDPIRPWLRGSKTVFISTDSFLERLPFEIIQAADGSFLVEDFSFSYIQSPTQIQPKSSSNPSSAPSLLAVGGLEYAPGSPQSSQATTRNLQPDAGLRGEIPFFEKLPGTETEVKELAGYHEAHFQGSAHSELLMGAEALEQRIKSTMNRFDIVHIATHGIYLPPSVPSAGVGPRADSLDAIVDGVESRIVVYYPGLLCGLALSGVNQRSAQSADDGFMTAEEVGALDLRAVNLIVLSACQTGAGTFKGFGDTVSLRRAFRIAGARFVLSSLWPIHDRYTIRFMRVFYRELFEGAMDVRAAFHKAQKTILNRNRSLAGDPRPQDWAAFVLSGGS